MSLVCSGIGSVRDVLNKYDDREQHCHEISKADINRLINYLNNNGVYNEFDLKDRTIVQRLRDKLYDKLHIPKYTKISKKFDAFINKVYNEDKANQSGIKHEIVNGVEVTRNAVLLQDYITHRDGNLFCRTANLCFAQ